MLHHHLAVAHFLGLKGDYFILMYILHLDWRELLSVYDSLHVGEEYLSLAQLDS